MCIHGGEYACVLSVCIVLCNRGQEEGRYGGDDVGEEEGLGLAKGRVRRGAKS